MDPGRCPRGGRSRESQQRLQQGQRATDHARSMIRWLFTLLLALSAVALAGRARAEPIRILVAAAHRDGIEGERPLHHARDDVQRVRELFTTLGGVRPENALVLDEPTPEE